MRFLRVLAVHFLAAAPFLAPPCDAHCVGQPCWATPRTGFGTPGTPLTLTGAGSSRGGHVTIADLGITPGHKSLVFGTSTGKLYVLKSDGSIATGWPVTLPREIVSSPAVGQLTLGNGSTVTAIVVGYGSNFSGQTDAGGIRAYDTGGNLLWEALSGPYVGATAPVVSAPAIGDIDGDGKNEVVWTSFDERIHATSGAGVEKPGFPVRTFDTIWSSPALFDLDGDGKLEIIVGSDQHFQDAPIYTPDGGGLWVVRSDGSPYPGFPQYVDQVISSSPAVGDIDGDGRPEIVVGTGGFYSGRTHALYAFHCDGTRVAGWPVTVQGQVFTAPALADLNGDGVPEVIATDDNSSPDGKFRVYAFRGDGSQVFTPVIPLDYNGVNLSAGDPLIADVLGDSAPEILVPTNGEICVVSSGGVQLTDGGPSSPNGITFGGNLTGLSSIAAGTLDNSATKIDVVAVAGIWPSGVDLGVVVSQPEAFTAQPPWGVFHYDAVHSGVFPGTAGNVSCLGPSKLYTLVPCRLLDTRGISPGAIGGPSFSPNETRTLTLTGRCSVPSNARSLVLNVTVTGTSASGYLTLFGAGTSPRYPTGSVAFRPAQTRASAFVVDLSKDGTGRLDVTNVSTGATHVILDVSGYFR